ncbi:MAG TPA: hypothetical protein VMU27_01495 [Candidatus Paceibacterota bacterium]|nr:hypothetical protein [Candidatus Paceibacterota bacterium]
MDQKAFRKLLTASEFAIFKKLDSPAKTQDFLDTIPFNHETHGETYMSPRRMLRAGVAHCFEGALFAAAALSLNGEKPLLLDLNAERGDQDHVAVLFQRNGYWGAISKTNHAVLRYRDPVYKSVRELALSYFHEYFLEDGRKTLRSYSKPFDLSKYPLESWLTFEEDLVWIANALTEAKHFPIAPRSNMRVLRKATPFEIQTVAPIEWNIRSKKKRS